MSVEPVPFVYYVVDLSLRDIVDAKGETVTLCQIEANSPLDYHGKELGQFYSWSRVIEPRTAIELEVGCFCLVIVNCGIHYLCFATSHSIPEDPTFVMKLIEDETLLEVKGSNITIDLKANFDFIIFDSSQKVRIETIPEIETLYEMRELKHKKGGEDA